MNFRIPRSGVIDPETINTHYLCYQCSKHGQDVLLGKLRIKGCNDEPHVLQKKQKINE